jgi:hypothetical protein
VSIPAGEKPDERDERASFISDLRAMADLLENEPRLPIPHGMYGTVYLNGPSHDLARLFALADLLGTEVIFDRSRGVCEAQYKRGAVTYELYINVGKPPKRQDDKIVVTSPVEIFSSATEQAQEMLRQLDEIGERLEREGEQLDHAHAVMSEAVAVHEEMQAEREEKHEAESQNAQPDADKLLGDTPAGEPSC